jgi:hypothetical protein
MKYIISGLLFIIIIFVYKMTDKNVNPFLFMYLCWFVGYFKDIFDEREKSKSS